MLAIEGVSKTFGRPLFESASMRLEAGQGALLTAPNGSGKSTLLKMIVGVLLPDSGTILLDGKPVSVQRSRLAYCPAGQAGFYPRLTARQNLHFFGSLYGLGRRQVDAWLEAHDCFGVDYWDAPSERLSDGMLQKAKILRTLMHEPDFAAFDEPLNFLDAASRQSFVGWLGEWRARRPGRAYLVTQHSADLTGAHWTIRDRRLEVSA